MAQTVNPDSVTTPSLDEGGRPKRSLSLRRYRVIVWVAFASLYVIIVTGSLVRLTGSGLGCIDWGRFVSVLGDTGYHGPVCVEVEDRAFEKSLATRKLALRQSHTYLRQFIPRLDGSHS